MIGSPYFPLPGQEYNKELSGVPGVKITEMDNAYTDLPYTVSEYTEPVNGKDVSLTIDENIQAFAESIAEQAYKDQKAKANLRNN